MQVTKQKIHINYSLLGFSAFIILAIGGMGFADNHSAESILPPNWTGTYIYGDGLSENCTLILNSNGTFTFISIGDLGTNDENEGNFSFKDGSILLHPNKPNVQDGVLGTPTEFYAVAWGKRKYLVPKEKMIEFCSETNLGMEPRIFSIGSFYFKAGDSKRKAPGYPNVPLEYKKYLLKKPILGHVTSVLNAQEAIMDKGAAGGLLAGMILVAQDPRGFNDFQVEILSVNEHDCKIKARWEDYNFVIGQNVVSKDPNFFIPQ